MPVSFDGNYHITITGFTALAPCTFLDIYNADKAGTYSLHARNGLNAVDGAAVAVDNALRPTDYGILGGASGDLYITITNWNLMTNATIRVTGTDRDGAAQTEDVVVNANGDFNTAKWFKTVTHTQVTVFNTPGGGSFDYELFQGQWGMIYRLGDASLPGYSFLLDANLIIGDGVNATYFKDTLQRVEWTDVNARYGDLWWFPFVEITTNARFYLGEEETPADKSSSRGCSVYFHTGSISTTLKWGNASYGRLLSSQFAAGARALMQAIVGVAAELNVWNCLFTYNWEIDSFYNADWFNVTQQKWVFSGLNAPTGTLERVYCIEGGHYGYEHKYQAQTVRGVYIRRATTNSLWMSHGLNIPGRSLYFIDGDLDAWTINWMATVDPSNLIYRQYSFNLRVIDGAGDGISGATVSMVDVNGTPVFSVNTDVNGDIVEQIITYGTYTRLDGNAMTPYSPHTVIIGKAGYAPRIIIYNMDRKREEIEKLGGAAPHGTEYRRRRVPGEVSALTELE